MNWTGGALSRSRNANANLSLSVKQKNHFAKARVKLQHGQRPSLHEIQYFDFGEPGSRVQDERRSDPVRRRASSQKTPDQFENVQGVVRKLKSLRPKNKGDQGKRSPINDTEGHVLPSGIAIPPISPGIINPRPRSSSSPIHTEPAANRNFKRLRTIASPTSDELYPLATLDSVEDKRRKLLQESDWVGIERQRRNSKPVKMDFTDPKDRDLIGRRRALNDSAVQNRWNVQHSKPMKIPLIASDFEKQRGLNRGLADKDWSVDGMSIRIGSTATVIESGPDEIPDCYQSPRPIDRSSHLVQTLEYDNARPMPKPQHQEHVITALSDCRDESSEPFHSLFTPDEAEQWRIAQPVEATTVADNDNLSLAEDELQLPEDYHFPEPELGFRLVFEKTPQPRGQTSEPHESSRPIVRDFAFGEWQPPASGAAIEQSTHPEDPNVLSKQKSRYAGVEDALSGTFLPSVATSRYMQEFENQSEDGPAVASAPAKSSAISKLVSRPTFPWPAVRPAPSPRPTQEPFMSGERRLFAKAMANATEATAGAQSAANRDKAEEERGTTIEQEPKIPIQPDEVQSKESIRPTEDEDEIWRKFIYLDDANDIQWSQAQPPSTHSPHATTVRASVPKKAGPGQAPPKPNAQQAPPSPQDDDEMVWQRFIFSDSDPNDHQWVIEEASRPEIEPPTDSRTSTHTPARTQPSMVAEAATSPVKQNPHLLAETLDSPAPILDNASRYATASTSSTGSPVIAEAISSRPHQVSTYPSDSPGPRSTQATTASSAPRTSALPLPTKTPRIPTPSPPTPETSSSSIPTRPIQPLSPTGATHNPSSDELAWTPTRLPAPPPKKKIIFKKPSRYTGARASDAPVHLGRNANGKGKKRKQKTRKLPEAVERARGKTGRKGRGKSTDGRDEGHAREETEGTDRDDIVDDWG